MKKITILCIALFSITYSFSQKVAIVGMNHNSTSPNTDGFTFVALEDLPNGEVIYFTENEYDAANDVFTFGIGTTGEGVVVFTATSAISKGTVIFVNETGTSTNVFTTNCCGTATLASITPPNPNGNGGFSLGTSGDGLYAYSDNNQDVRDAIGEIYSVMYSISGTIPANENPTSHPGSSDAIVVDGFTSGTPNRTEYKFSPASLRDAVSKTALENPTNYLNGLSNSALSTVPFTNLNLSGANPVLTVTRTPASHNENSGNSFTYTFNLSANATSNMTVNFNVSGSATFNTDYTVTGATTFNASTGTAVISSGTNSKAITITPSGDTTLEPDETVTLNLIEATGCGA